MTFVDTLLLESLGIFDFNEQQALQNQIAAVTPTTPLVPVGQPAQQPGPGTPTPGVDPVVVENNRRDALARIRDRLSQYDLGGLADWAWQQLQGGSTEDQIMLDIHDQPLYKQRFPYEDAMRAAGIRVLSPSQMLAVEAEYKRVQRVYGMTPSDNAADYTNLFVQQVSGNEFNERLGMFHKLRTVWSPFIRQQFASEAGIRNVSDEDVYKLFSGQDAGLARRYSESTGTNFHVPSWADMQEAERQAIARNQAEFSGGGGLETEDQPGEVVRRRRLTY